MIKHLIGLTLPFLGLPLLAAAPSATLFTWGNNRFWQLCDGTTTTSLTPKNGSGLTNVVAVSAGWQFALALRGDGTVWACGDNAFGQLGDGTTTARATPVRVAGLANVIAIAAGAGHSLALLNDGTVQAWGINGNGQLGDGTGANRLAPVAVPGLAGVNAIAAGYSHSLALLDDGRVLAWGYNKFGQVGDGGTADQLSPVPVSGLGNVRAIDGGIQHSLALLGDGTVRSWGDNQYGQLGDGTTISRSTPVAVPGVSGGVAIAAGGVHNLVLVGNGTIRAWGIAPTGDGTTQNRLSAVTVTGIANAIAISAGHQHSHVVLADGTVRGWGDNLYGDVGDGTTNPRMAPVVVPGLTGITAVSAGGMFSLALKAEDLSAPMITASIAGIAGANGWYTSDVTVTWTVADPESGIATSSGCAPATLTGNTRGTVLTCSATNGSGMAASQSVTVKIDRTPASVTPVIVGTLGANGWYTSAVTVTWTVADAESGTTSLRGCDQTTLAADTPGITLTCEAVNGAGLSSVNTVSLKVDRTPPTLTCAASPSVLTPVNNKLFPISVAVTPADSTSGMAGFTLIAVTSNEPDAGAIQDWTAGTPDVAGLLQASRWKSGSGRIYTLSYRATDNAGNARLCQATVSVPR